MLDHLKGKVVTQTAILLGVHTEPPRPVCRASPSSLCSAEYMRIRQTRPTRRSPSAEGGTKPPRHRHEKETTMTIHNFSRFMRGMSAGNRITGRGEALSDEQLRAAVPSIFATDAHESRSARFAPVPTITVLDGLRAEGFEPFRHAPALKAKRNTPSTCCACATGP